MWSRVFTIASILFIVTVSASNFVHSMVPPKVHYHHGPDVPGGEHLLCRYPTEFEPMRKHIDLGSQQRNGLRCDLKHFSQIQRPCDFRRVTRFSLVTITVPMQYAEDDLRCWYDPKTDTLHIEDATKRDDAAHKIKFNVYTVRDTIK